MIDRPVKPLLLDLLRQAHSSQNAFSQQAPAAELALNGAPDFWSAKDHVAHLTFWRRRLTLYLQAIVDHQPQPEAASFEQLNPLIFEEHRYHSWSASLAESDQAYADLIACSELLTEDDLTSWGRFDWVGDGAPLYFAYMGNCYDHTQTHLAQYFLDRNDLERAREIYEVWAKRVIEVQVPDALKGYMLYNLACFRATHGQLEQAAPALEQAFTLYPATREFSLTDPDLVALRPDSSG
jgi:tetratricopeptide (TPR) repeat protein